jgi:hypothetical protein
MGALINPSFLRQFLETIFIQISWALLLLHIICRHNARGIPEFLILFGRISPQKQRNQLLSFIVFFKKWPLGLLHRFT